MNVRFNCFILGPFIQMISTLIYYHLVNSWTGVAIVFIQMVTIDSPIMVSISLAISMTIPAGTKISQLNLDCACKMDGIWRMQ